MSFPRTARVPTAHACPGLNSSRPLRGRVRSSAVRAVLIALRMTDLQFGVTGGTPAFRNRQKVLRLGLKPSLGITDSGSIREIHRSFAALRMTNDSVQSDRR